MTKFTSYTIILALHDTYRRSVSIAYRLAIMELDIRKLLMQKKYSGEFNFEYVPNEKLSLIPLVEIKDVKVSGDYEIYDDDSVSVNLIVSYRLEGKCSYCLNSAHGQVAYSQEVLFLLKDDGENYCYNGIKLNLNTAVKDAILLSQPGILLCAECGEAESGKD